MGKRVAGDQHEILDFLYTEKTDRLAKKMAREHARSQKAAKRLIKSKPIKPTRPEGSAPPLAKVAAAAALALALGGGGWFVLTDYSFDPQIRADRAACKVFSDVPAPEDITSKEQAFEVARTFEELAWDDISPELASHLRKAADGFLYFQRTLSAGAPEQVTASARGYVAQGVSAAKSACKAV